MSQEDQGTEIISVRRGLDLVRDVAPTVEPCPREPGTNIIHGSFKRQAGPKVRIGDHGGPGRCPPAATIYHTMLACLDAGGRVNLVDCTWPAGTRILPHVHLGEDELLIVLSGTVEVRIAERSFRCGTGETIFMPRGSHHEVRALTKARAIAILTRMSLERPQSE